MLLYLSDFHRIITAITDALLADRLQLVAEIDPPWEPRKYYGKCTFLALVLHCLSLHWNQAPQSRKIVTGTRNYNFLDITYCFHIQFRRIVCTLCARATPSCP